MKINLKCYIRDYNGEVVKDNHEQPFLLRKLFSDALNMVQPGKVIPNEEKARRYQLTLKLYAHNRIDLSLDERKLIKDCVDAGYQSPLLYGSITELFEDGNLPSTIVDPKAEGAAAADESEEDKPPADGGEQEAPSSE